ncbi:hypothetical protein RB12755 [Rhodopirellula baltica SH 1]|uniref:Uncharacterized protein n=1 Tax=Rhodopirellula baltica (strain DSM 10527 / NCIMB 13988 / SH1) TaxID=243090 RepID=Q7UI52_RHOBA|nr:hypothetical protein RB12755 [Rhodopirellula baltica SH 1]
MSRARSWPCSTRSTASLLASHRIPANCLSPDRGGRSAAPRSTFNVARWGPQRAEHESSTVVADDVCSAHEVRAGMDATLLGFRELLDGTIGDNCFTLERHHPSLAGAPSVPCMSSARCPQ